jgi:hypothetical protein
MAVANKPSEASTNSLEVRPKRFFPSTGGAVQRGNRVSKQEGTTPALFGAPTSTVAQTDGAHILTATLTESLINKTDKKAEVDTRNLCLFSF